MTEYRDSTDHFTIKPAIFIFTEGVCGPLLDMKRRFSSHSFKNLKLAPELLPQNQFPGTNYLNTKKNHLIFLNINESVQCRVISSAVLNKLNCADIKKLHSVHTFISGFHCLLIRHPGIQMKENHFKYKPKESLIACSSCRNRYFI